MTDTNERLAGYSDEARAKYARIVKQIILKFGSLPVPDVVAYALLPSTVGGQYDLSPCDKSPLVDSIYLLAMASDEKNYAGSFVFSPESKSGPAEISIGSLTQAEVNCIETIRALENTDMYDYQEALLHAAYVLEPIADGQSAMTLDAYFDYMSRYDEALAIKSAQHLGFVVSDGQIVVADDMLKRVPMKFDSQRKSWAKVETKA